MAGPMAASMETAMLTDATATTTDGETATAPGSPNDWAVRATSGWLATTPATTPSDAPIATGTRICVRRMAVTWAGVKPTAFMTPMSR